MGYSVFSANNLTKLDIFMDELFKPEDIGTLGWRTCGAKTRSGGRCKNLAMYPAGRCRMHGGKSLRGLASPRYKHGRYSKDTLAMLTRAATAAANATDGRSPLAQLLGDLLDTSAADAMLGDLANITNT